MTKLATEDSAQIEFCRDARHRVYGAWHIDPSTALDETLLRTPRLLPEEIEFEKSHVSRWYIHSVFHGTWQGRRTEDTKCLALGRWTSH